MNSQNAHAGLRGSDLLQSVLDFQQNKWIQPKEINALSAKLGIRDIVHEINFLREFKELVRSIPLKAYPDPEQRERMLDAIQLALDDAIDREEAEDELE